MTDPSGQCVDDGSNVPDYSVNRINGSFSTNYIRVGAWYRRTTLAENREDKAVSLGLTYEANPVHFMGGAGIHGLLAEEYGRNRVTVSGNINQILNDRGRHVEVQGTAQAIIGANSRVPPVSFSAQISFFPGNSDWGVFANYFRGQDYYNAGFADLVSKGTIGATYTYDGFFLWRRK